jgi:hypothetical protein
MTLSKRLAVATVFVLTSAVTTFGQTKLPAETKNAALRYWMAFAELHDTDADKSIADLLGKTMSGEGAWDETKLGPIVDVNMESIGIMQRAAKLPECDWGLEYSLGPRTPIPFLQMSARALGRLNTLYGMRLAAKGDTQKAVDTWLAGIRFSQHLARGGSLLATLVANAALADELRPLTKAAQSGALDARQRSQIVAAIRAVPETGFDWGQAMWYEEIAGEVAITEMGKAANPAAYYKELMETPAPENFTVPKAAEIAAYRKFMNSVEEALRLPPDAASERLKTLQDSAKTLHPFFRDSIPSLTRINDARIETQAARQKLLQAVAAK